MKRFNRVFWAALLVAAFALMSPVMASAHEHRDLADGRYTVVVGFSTEPAYTGFMNGLDFRVSDNSLATPAADGGDPVGAPVDGLEETLQAEIIFGNEKMALTLEPRWQSPGEYDAWVVPMAAGDYSFHIFGTIGDTAIDETFSSSPETFGSVGDQATLQFPKAAASSGAAAVFGTVAGESTMNTEIFGGALLGLVAGAAGLFLVQRRSRQSTPALAVTRAGTGD